MAVTTRSQVEGFKEIEKVLKALPGRLAEAELTKAVRAGAGVIVKEAKARAPRGGVTSEMSKKFGPLHKKIRARRVKKGRHSVEFVVNEGSAFYGYFLEFGRKPGVSKKGRRYPGMDKRPWMTPAFDTSAPAAVIKLGERLGKGVEKVTTELAGKFGSIRKSTLRRL
ncbi:MAG: HK97 gp10 family phage protein [Proteobacteria bacterium]|nr:HK97 gp10 family phage protein [Pseudomonadota bacterium]